MGDVLTLWLILTYIVSLWYNTRITGDCLLKDRITVQLTHNPAKSTSFAGL